MTTIQGSLAGAGGYVRAVFSARCRGYAVPLELMRMQARVASRVAVRRRLAAAMADYLVSDSAPPSVEVVRPVPIWRDRAGRVVVVECCQSTVHGLIDDGGIVPSMDAPVFMPAGVMQARYFGMEVYVGQVLVERERLCKWWCK